MVDQFSDSEIIFIAIILLIAISVLVILFVGIFWIFLSESGRKDRFTFASLAKIFFSLFPFLKPNNEIIPSSSASRFVIAFPKGRLKNRFQFNQRVINLMGVPLTAALMVGLMFVLARVHAVNQGYSMDLETWLWSILNVFISTAGGGGIGLRIAHLSWQQTVLAALLAGMGTMLILGFEFSPLYPGLWDYFSGISFFNIFLIELLTLITPVFLLPLCDPVLRQKGPAPSWREVALGAFVISCVFAPIIQLSWVIIVIIFTAFLLGLGAILSLYHPTSRVGAGFGGIGLLLLPLNIFGWWLLVTGSFG